MSGTFGTLAELAARIGGTVLGDGSLQVERIASVDEAGAGALTFATDERYLAHALASPASAVLVDASLAPAESPKPLLLVPSARVALAALLQMLRPPRPAAGRHPSAVVEEGAQVAADAHLGPHVYVGRDSIVGPRVVLEAGAYVGARVRIGADSWLRPQTRVMDDCVLGERVALFPGATIGSEGFGWAFVDGRLERIPQVGNVVLGDDVEIGANSCVDRAQTGSTSIGAGTKLDNLVMVGHNCKIGKSTAIAALCGLAGTTTIGDYTRVAGMVGFKGHITVGSRVTIAGDSQVWGDVPDGIMISGAPAIEHRERLRKEVTLRNLPKLIARVEALERAAKKTD
jgi:UDP-3-O-[3-hydroxymyristoyl] glucosamine N-acyltransferase